MSALGKGGVVLALMVLADVVLAVTGLLSWRIVLAGLVISAVEVLKIFLIMQRFRGSGSNKEGMISMAVEVGTFLLAAVLMFGIANPMAPGNKWLAIAYCVNFMVARVGGYLVVQDKLS